jgi:hypothetical protein
MLSQQLLSPKWPDDNIEVIYKSFGDIFFFGVIFLGNKVV